MSKLQNSEHNILCSDYVLSRGYNTRSPTQDEIDFPIAYVGVIYNEICNETYFNR